MFETGQDVLKYGFVANARRGVGHGRMRFMYVALTAMFLLFVGRTFYLGIQGTDRARQRGTDGTWTASRADIVDRNGDILAKNIMSGHIMLRPREIRDADAAAAVIHDALPYEYTVADALRLIQAGRFKYIKHYASDSVREKIQQAKIPGLEIEQVQTRKYPKHRLFSHIVGFVGSEGRGLEGAERTYEKYLTENNDALQLSLDSRIQAVFYEQLSVAMQRYNAKAAMGMLMNSRTGEIVAMVSLPDFDPENIEASPVANRTVRPMRTLSEMGSIFKVFNTALALENGIEKEYLVTEPYKILDKFGRVAHTVNEARGFKPPRPKLTVDEIMQMSSNRGSAQIALDLPDGAQKEFFERLHMTGPLDLEFGRTERALTPIKWGPVEKATVAFGHGISVTPMHLMLAVNAMTNGGIYIYPTLRKRGVGAVRGERVISEEVSARLRQNMLHVVEDTSGRQARIAGIDIGGKTGTAEKRDARGHADRTRNLTAFAGVFPIQAPLYTILIILDEPNGTKETWGLKTAAWNAVPTAGKILDSILPLLFE